MKKQWSDGTRKRTEPKKTMSIEEQGRLHSSNLKQRWDDPMWKERQRIKLKEAWQRRQAVS